MPAREIAGQGTDNVNNASKTSRYRPEIDGLRAFAVVAVIINHFNKDILPGGYLGVDIFFVISGYVITSSLFGRPSKDFKDFISGFYERRIKRLVPALTVFVLIMSIAICLFNPSPGLSLQTGLTSLFGLSNLYLLKQSTDYFAQSTELNVFTHTWSLGVEEQFYILFPFLIWFSGFGRQTKNGARNLFLIVGVLTIASLIGFLHLYPTNQPAAYFLMPSRFWEMAAGCLIFIGFQKRASIEQFLEKVPPLLVLVLIVGVMYLPMSMAATSTIAVVALSSILIASLKKQTATFKVFTHPRVVYIGLISYSLYLWHWGVLSISRWTIGIHWWSVPLQVALMLCLAIGSYRWIETPLRKGNWLGKRWKTLILGISILVSLSVIIEGFLRTKSFRFLYAGNSKSIKCKPYHYETCVPKDFPHLATVPFVKGTSIQREQCIKYDGVITDQIMKKCTIPGINDTSQMIFVAGSSYVNSQSPAFSILRDRFGVGLSMLFITSCDLDPSFVYRNNKGTCRSGNSNRMKFLEENISEGDIIYTGPSNNFIDKDSVTKLAEFAKARKINLIYHTPIPSWTRLDTGQNNLCQEGKPTEWFNRLSSSSIACNEYSEIPKSIYINKFNPDLNFLSSIERENSFFHVFNIQDLICDVDACPSHKKGVRIYRDNVGHLSIPFVKDFLSEDIQKFLLKKNLISSKT